VKHLAPGRANDRGFCRLGGGGCSADPTVKFRQIFAAVYTIEAAQAMLGCGRSRIFELLKSGALRRAPKLGKVAMIHLPSLEALMDGIDREPAPKLKRRPAQHNAGRGEKDAILKLIRRA
jgi:hypothetical protein